MGMQVELSNKRLMEVLRDVVRKQDLDKVSRVTIDTRPNEQKTATVYIEWVGDGRGQP
jgi:hypothetical protein